MDKIVFLTRYYLCTWSLMFSIWTMPEGKYKEEFKKRVYGLRDEAIQKVNSYGKEEI